MNPSLEIKLLRVLCELADALDAAETGWTAAVVKRVRDVRAELRELTAQWKQEQADATPR